jgi:magnesium transporter
MLYYTKEEILEIIRNHELGNLKEKISDWPVQDIAELITSLEEPISTVVFRSLPHKISSEVFSYLEVDSQEKLLASFTNKETEQILADLSPDDRAALFDELPGVVTRRLFKLMKPEDIQEIKMILGYPEESVGRMMTPDYVSIDKDMTIKEALAKIRKRGMDTETLNRIYVTDADIRNS